MSVIHPLTAPTNRSTVADTVRNAVFLLLSMPVMLAGFTVVIILVSLGVGTVVIWVGLPILSIGVLAARGFAEFHRRTVAALRGEEPVRPHYGAAPPDAGMHRRFLAPLRDPQSWLDVLWVLVGFFVSVLTWSVAVAWLAGSLGVLVGPLRLVPGLGFLGGDGLAALLSLPFAPLLDAAGTFAIGLLLLLTAPAVLRGLMSVQTGFADLLLVDPSRNRERVTALTTSRADAREAEREALSRLERDIHDGPQQRLVRLQMDLARARQHAATDPQKADLLLADAMVQTQDTLAELRNLSRGIAPPILVDRGLEAAVTELAAGSEVLTTVFAHLPDRLPAHVEATAYFVVAESLTNINKHSRAQEASVTLSLMDTTLLVSVTDDGIGGASQAKGHGLAGLRRRLSSVDGRLDVTSPEGGPTRVEAMIPCAS